MQYKRFVLALFFALSVLVALAGVASADSSQGGRVRLENATVPWLVPYLEGGLDESLFQCPGIPAGLQISPDDFGSDRLTIAKVQELPQNGGRRITVDDTVSGTASDQYGGSYTFLYHNKATLNYDGAGAVHVSVLDAFHMRGGAVDYTVGFNWRWSFAAPDGIELVEEYVDGVLVSLGVSPFPFATDDGYTESANIIPGSWRQIRTNGFILGCDPL
jgi:hypothetical protein